MRISKKLSVIFGQNASPVKKKNLEPNLEHPTQRCVFAKTSGMICKLDLRLRTENVKFNIHRIYLLFEGYRPYVLISHVMASVRKIRVRKSAPLYPFGGREGEGEGKSYFGSAQKHSYLFMLLFKKGFP